MFAITRLLNIEVLFHIQWSLSSLVCWELAGLLSSKCRGRSRKIINMHNGRVHDVIYCYNLGEKMRSSILMKCLGLLISVALNNKNNKLD